ncbi:MAG: sugar ABC transporter substrate-binding protein [Gammaproteobacteria bacterium]|nr:sugar ABC transporter substrate-binding protein [Gammaproteobacteria bacterium]MCY4228449.1 sugar ABC transporter substrate-binding protein [Gammaproteobacteria bacterium]
MKLLTKCLTKVIVASMMLASSLAVFAQEDPGPEISRQALDGKRVVLMPMAMGFDLAQGWAHYIGREVRYWGGIFETRDPNWSVEAGSQALTDVIASKPDVIIVHNPDLRSYVKLFKRAQEAGIYVIQIDNRSAFNTDAFIGSNWEKLGELEATAALRFCGEGTSGKIGLIQGEQVNASSIDQYNGIMNIIDANDSVEVVSKPYSGWDATKAQEVTTTMLQQHPDLCAIIDFWDGTATGTAAAIRAAGKTGQVRLITTGGGEEVACKMLNEGTIDAIVSTEVRKQSQAVNATIKTLLQSGLPAGTMQLFLYTHEVVTTKDDIYPGFCWSLDKNAADTRDTQ